MKEMQIGDQTIHYDRDATAAIYGTLEHGDAEECDCTFCKNLAGQRELVLVYPASFRALLGELSNADPLRTDVTSMAAGFIWSGKWSQWVSAD